MPEGSTFGGGVTTSVISPAALCVLLICALLILVLPRRFVIVPFLAGIFLIPIGQLIYVFGAHWFPARVIILVAALRLVAMKSTATSSESGVRFTSIDRAVIGYIVAQVAAVILSYRTPEAVFNQFGYLIDALLGFIVLRSLVRDDRDAYRALKCIAVICVLLALGMVLEQVTHRNIFGSIYPGFVTAVEVRNDKIRSQGTFQHPLMAGTFSAMLIPLFLMLWRNAGAKTWAIMGLIGSTLMTVTSNSSTPLLTYVAGILGLCLWRIRKKMRILRWALVSVVAGLAVVMKAPVWFLIARIDLTGSSSGYHRAELVDQFIRHFTDWWLIGVKITAAWGWDMWDAQNQFVNIGETGGLIALVFFILVIVRSFRAIGNARKIADGNSMEEWQLWCVGSSLFANVVGFFGVNYYDQSKVGWFLLLSVIAAATNPILLRKTVRGAEQSPDGAVTSLLSTQVGIPRPTSRFSRFSSKQIERPR